MIPIQNSLFGINFIIILKMLFIIIYKFRKPVCDYSLGDNLAHVMCV